MKTTARTKQKPQGPAIIRRHDYECIDACLSQAIPVMTCSGCSSEYLHLRREVEWTKSSQRTQDEIGVIKQICEEHKSEPH